MGHAIRWTVFDEVAYLAAYPDVAAAVERGAFASGLQHFQRHGLREGRTQVSSLYDEAFYPRNNPDVAAVVSAGGLRSGLEHYLRWGEGEGRRPSVAFDEVLYLRRYGDVAAAKQGGAFASALQHYVQYGQAEGRSGAALNETAYRAENSDVAAAIAAGAFPSGMEHYRRYGQWEPTRAGLFYGSAGDDTITGFGAKTQISGADFGSTGSLYGRTIIEPVSRGERDLLIGGAGVDSFRLGNSMVVRGFYRSIPLYSERGDADVAVIRNFERSRDEIFLVGPVADYTITPSPEGVRIANRGDWVAIVEGITDLTIKTENPFVAFNNFTLT